MTDQVDRILSPAVPAPAGHYSQATAWRDLVFVSGQLGPRSDGTHTDGEPFPDPGAPGLGKPVGHSGRGRRRSGAGAPDDGLYRRCGELAYLRSSLCGGVRRRQAGPTVVPVPELHHGYLVEVDAIAVRHSHA